jgi:hypothetical protein
MIITGKIKKLVIGVNNPYGFILSDVNIKGQPKDPVFWENDVTDCLFSDLSVGDIVQFDAVEWVDRNGDIQIIARQVKSRISGVIKFIKINKFNQLSFCGYIQPDKNWLGHMIDIGFFSDSFKDNTLHNFIHYCNSSFDSKYLYKFINGIRVNFSVQEWKSNNPDITKAAKKIKLVDAKLNQLPVNKSSTKLLKDKITYFLDRIESVSDPYEFEDLVFTLLRLIGINKIYKYDRGNAAGKADGVFVLGNRSVRECLKSFRVG